MSENPEYGQPNQPGAYPPPAGYYPPPAAGGYPPSAAGYYPPAYPPAGYPGAPGYGPGYVAPFNVGDALTWAWNKFSKNPAPFIVVVLVIGFLLAAWEVLMQIGIWRFSDHTVHRYRSTVSGFYYSAWGHLTGGGIAVLVIGYLVMLVVGAILASAYTGGLLEVADGRRVEVGSFFKPRLVGRVIALQLFVGVLELIGLALCILPGLIVGLFAMFSLYALIERNLSPIDAFKASIEIVKANLGQAILLSLVASLIGVAGELMCCVGLLVSMPVAQLMVVYAYRRFSGGYVAPLTP